MRKVTVITHHDSECEAHGDGPGPCGYHDGCTVRRPAEAHVLSSHSPGCSYEASGGQKPCEDWCTAAATHRGVEQCPPHECRNFNEGRASKPCAGRGCMRVRHVFNCHMHEPGGDYCSEDCAVRLSHAPKCPKRWNLTVDCAGDPACVSGPVALLATQQVVRTARTVVDMLVDVERFNRKVCGLPVPEKPTALDAERLQWTLTALREEVDELELAGKNGDVVDSADALVDLTYFALGRLVEMGVPVRAVFDGVQRANMAKVRGELSKRPGSKGHDAVKPEGWTPPDHSFLLDVRRDDIQALPRLKEVARRWEALSPVMRRAVELRESKGSDYNDVPGGRDAYWVFGDYSFAQMVWTKALRLVSLVKQGTAPKFESVYDTIVDQVNYLCYWGESLLKRKQDPHNPLGK